MPDSPPDILHHYCSSDAFTKMVSTRSIWLSSLSLSNDALEGKLIQELIFDRAERVVTDEFQLDRFQESVGRFLAMFDGLGFCLSEEGDLLSQWRGYADDAHGVSIGFSTEYLTAIERRTTTWGNARPKSVLYEAEEHAAIVDPVFAEMIKFIEAGALEPYGHVGLMLFSDEEAKQKAVIEDLRIEKANLDMIATMVPMLADLFRLKGRAFREEREWRILSMAAEEFKECHFRASGGRVVPYRVLPLPPSDLKAIKSVTLGPKHQTPERVVRALLEANKFLDVHVTRSEASYR